MFPTFKPDSSAPAIDELSGATMSHLQARASQPIYRERRIDAGRVDWLTRRERASVDVQEGRNMDRLGRALWVAAFVTMAGPVAAQTRTFDGTYVGVSATLVEAGRNTRGCQAIAAPPTITIAGGATQIRWGTTGVIQASVTPQGALTGKNDYGSRLAAQIDARGTITGTIGAACAYQSVWRKR